MAFEASNFYNISCGPPGFGLYLYTSDTDSEGTVSADGYFNNLNDTQILSPRDTIIITGVEGGYSLEVSSVSSGSVSTALKFGSQNNKQIVSKTANYTATPSDDIIECDGNFDVTLYTAVGNTGREVTLKNIGTSAVGVVGTGGQTVEGETRQTLPSKPDSFTFYSDGANWRIQ